MNTPHAKLQREPAKKHGDALEIAMHDQDAHTRENQRTEERVDAVPPAEDGGHAHSAAAHLNAGGKEHTKPKGNLRHGADPGALREPPMVVQRVGKQHRG